MWAFDTKQFDDILKKLNIQAAEIKDDEVVRKEEVRETKSPKKSNETVIKATRPQGRYKRKEREKRVDAYSAQDLEGILAKKVDESPVPKDLLYQMKTTLVQKNSSNWWGNKFGFVSGGLLGAQSKKKKSRTSDVTQNCNKRTAFHEDDQENLYKLVQDKATSGKQGLGIKDRPRKVAGVHFQGKKTSFSDSDREESESEDDHSSAKRKFDNISESQKGNEPKVKLKKLCRKLLRQVPEKSLKLKQLKVLIDEHSSLFSNFSSEKDALAFLRKKLEGSKKFRVEGKRVRL
ncbi:hypothetical protein Tco_0898449 [Tanacetum coccineum]